MAPQFTPAIQVIPLTEKASMEGISEMDFLIRITPPELKSEKVRHPINVGLVIDRSGSMSGSKLARAREAACYCVEQLLPTDRVSVTVFDHEVDVIVPSVSVVDKGRIKQHIKKVDSGGTTALHAAWVQGAKQVAAFLNPEQLNRVILLTDGQANVGLTDPDVITAQAKGLFEKGVSTTTMGVGNDFNEDLLEPMARHAGGNSWFIEGPEDFPRIFGMEMEGLVREVCSKVSLKIEPAQGVALIDVMNDFELTSYGTYMLPALIAGEALDVVLRVRLPGGAPGQFHCLGLTLKWDEKGERERFAERVPVSVVYASAAEAAGLPQNPEVVKAFAILEAARAKRAARDFVDRGDYRSASESLRDQSVRFSIAQAAMPDLDIAEEIASLEQLSRDLADRTDLYRVRKQMTYQSSQAQRGRRDRKK